MASETFTREANTANFKRHGIMLSTFAKAQFERGLYEAVKLRVRNGRAACLVRRIEDDQHFVIIRSIDFTEIFEAYAVTLEEWSNAAS